MEMKQKVLCKMRLCKWKACIKRPCKRAGWGGAVFTVCEKLREKSTT